MAGPALSKTIAEFNVVSHLVTLYDNPGVYGKDVKIATLAVLCIMFNSQHPQGAEYQEAARDCELHMALLDDLENLCYGTDPAMLSDYGSMGPSANTSVVSNILSFRMTSSIEAKSTTNSQYQSNNKSRYINKTADSVLNFFQAEKVSFTQSEGNDDFVGPKGNITRSEETLIWWIVYSLKSLCCNNHPIVSDIVKAVDNKEVLLELINIG